MKNTNEILRKDFDLQVENATKLKNAILEQLHNLFTTNNISLGVPMEGRVKSWVSITDKIERKILTLQKIDELDDFIGIRVILLFLPDLQRVDELLRSTFDIVSVEDAASRLSENQFGYQSQHYVLKIPLAWTSIPSFFYLGNFKFEIQVRTLAQHIWAAASHKLQYKHEDNVPPPFRRAINRVSALLETADLEFERILNEREMYIEIIDSLDPTEPLNVDIVQSILSELLPADNKDEDENYSELLDDLFHFEINTAEKLRNIIQENMNAIMEEEGREVASRYKYGVNDGSEERMDNGVFFTHVGLTRQALCEVVGDTEVYNWLSRKMKEKSF